MTHIWGPQGHMWTVEEKVSAIRTVRRMFDLFTEGSDDTEHLLGALIERCEMEGAEWRRRSFVNAMQERLHTVHPRAEAAHQFFQLLIQADALPGEGIPTPDDLIGALTRLGKRLASSPLLRLLEYKGDDEDVRNFSTLFALQAMYFLPYLLLHLWGPEAALFEAVREEAIRLAQNVLRTCGGDIFQEEGILLQGMALGESAKMQRSDPEGVHGSASSTRAALAEE